MSGSGVVDCVVVCDGTAVLDCIDVCDGTAVEDCAGVCGGDAVVGGCDNACGSTAVEDECGVCGGDGSTCASLSCSDLPAGDNTLYLAADGTVYYNFTTTVAGFQFNVDGTTMTGAAGGDAASAGFTVSAGGSTALGFSFTGATIAAGSGVLTELTLAGAPTGLSGIVLSDSGSSDVTGSTSTAELCEE